MSRRLVLGLSNNLGRYIYILEPHRSSCKARYVLYLSLKQVTYYNTLRNLSLELVSYYDTLCHLSLQLATRYDALGYLPLKAVTLYNRMSLYFSLKLVTR